MNSKEKPDDFYERFREKLEKSQNWPGLYMFKFITNSNSNQINRLKDLFNNPTEGVSLVNSSKKKYQSLTITIEMKSPLEVIAIYKNPEKVHIVDEEKIPEEFFQVKETKLLNKDKLKESLKNGEDIPGCELIQEKRISIK